MKTFRAQEACKITEVGGSTLRAWHSRLGFLPRPDGGWREYDLFDLIAIRVVAVLTALGLSAGEAVQMAHALMPEIKAAGRGFASRIAIGRRPDDGSWEATPFGYGSRMETVFDFAGEVSFVMNLGSITRTVFDRCRELQGLPTMSEALAAGKVTIIGSEDE